MIYRLVIHGETEVLAVMYSGDYPSLAATAKAYVDSGLRATMQDLDFVDSRERPSQEIITLMERMGL